MRRALSLLIVSSARAVEGVIFGVQTRAYAVWGSSNDAVGLDALSSRGGVGPEDRLILAYQSALRFVPDARFGAVQSRTFRVRHPRPISASLLGPPCLLIGC